MLTRRMRKLSRTILLLVLLAGLGGAALRGQPAHLIRDINTTPGTGELEHLWNHQFTILGNLLFFVLGDGNHGIELWVSDGTAAGTRLFADLCPGACSSSPVELTVSNGLLFFAVFSLQMDERALWVADPAEGTVRIVKFLPSGFSPGELIDVNGILYFSASDPAHGRELWRSDGTEAGTWLVKDINPGPESSSPFTMAASGGLLLLSADDGSHSREPWISDGTAEGTILLAEAVPGPSSSWIDREAVALPGGKFLFRAYSQAEGEELWVSDGTPAGTSLLKDLHPGISSSDPTQLTVLDDKVFFTTNSPPRMPEVKELWVTDGTEEGTFVVRNFSPGPAGHPPIGLTALGDRLFFRANDGVHGEELWTSDGTPAGTALFKDFAPGPAHSSISGGPIAFGSELLFFLDGSGWRNLWRSDGTAAGTVQVTVPFEPPYFPSTSLDNPFAVVAGRLFYISRTSTRFTLLASDGTQAGTVPIKTVLPPQTSSIAQGATWGGKVEHDGLLLFAANDGVSGNGLWRSDGTAAGTFLVAGEWANHMTLVDGSVFFTDLSSLWKTDGTSGGTGIVRQNIFPRNLKAFNGSLFFGGWDEKGGVELWKSDGTEAGTVLVKDVAPGGDQTSSDPRELTVSGENLFFVARTGESDVGLWKTDGTTAGTVRLQSPGLAPAPLYPSGLMDNGGTLFFGAHGPGFTFGSEPWKSDGTDAGTTLIKEIWPGPLSSGGFGAVSLPGGLVVFPAGDGVSGVELWKSDGTEAGTVLVKDIHPGPGHSSPNGLTVAGGKVYFSAHDGAHGRELWVSDGTEAGTRLVEDLSPGLTSSLPHQLYAEGSVIAFAATDGRRGVELWRSDGTALGTRIFQDIAPGAPSSSPTMFQTAGPNFYFAANDGVTGLEPWVMPRTAFLATFADVPAEHWAWSFVEALARSGLTSGCGGDNYCPGATLTRAQAAVLLTRSIHGADFVPPPATGTVFTDVPAGYWAAPWIEQIAADGLTGGCSANPPRYCPEQPLDRAALAVLLLRAKHGSSYTPPPATGTVFTDIPAGYWAAPWIEQLAAEGITTGCGGGAYCPGNAVNRAEMAVFLVRTFNLPLP